VKVPTGQASALPEIAQDIEYTPPGHAHPRHCAGVSAPGGYRLAWGKRV